MYRKWIACVFILVFYSSSGFPNEINNNKKDQNVSDGELVKTEEKSGDDLALVSVSAIKKVNINIHPIFDESNPAENNFLFRLANRLHIGTKVDVIKKDLLFSEGSILDKDELYESERILRSRRYLNKAAISINKKVNVNKELSVQNGESVPEENAVQEGVEVDVDVNEVWTLQPTFGFSRSGGNDEYSFGFQDSNFLGYGKSFTVEYNSSDERTGQLFEYRDPNTGWHQTQLALAYESNSDGDRNFFSFKRPYFSLSTPNSGGISYEKYDREESYFDEGDEINTYERRKEETSLFYGYKLNVSDELHIHRLNIGYLEENDQFFSLPDQDVIVATPENRVFKIAWGEYDYIQNKFSRLQNIRQINRTEDINFGWQARFRLGYTYSTVPKFDGSIYGKSEFSRGFSFDDNNKVLLFKGGFSGFYGDNEIYNGVASTQLNFHWKNSERAQFYVGLRGARGLRLFNDQFLAMGGEQGLRGYDDNYQSGDKSYLLSLEQRFYGKREWLSLFYMGFVVFYDEGRAWGKSASPQAQDGRLRDYGFGLRFSGTRNGSREEGSHNVLHIDFANPLDGGDDLSSTELSIRVKKSF